MRQGEHEVRRDISVRLYVANTSKANEDFKRLNENLANLTGITVQVANRSIKKQRKGTIMRGKVADIIVSAVKVYYTDDLEIQYDNYYSDIHYKIGIEANTISGSTVENWNCGSYTHFEPLGSMLNDMQECIVPENFILCK